MGAKKRFTYASKLFESPAARAPSRNRAVADGCVPKHLLTEGFPPKVPRQRGKTCRSRGSRDFSGRGAFVVSDGFCAHMWSRIS